MHLRLALAPRNRLQVTRLRLEDTANGHEALNVVSRDQLFATQDVNEVECLREDALRFGVNHADDWVVSGLLQARLLNQDAQFLAIAPVDFLKGLDHELVHC